MIREANNASTANPSAEFATVLPASRPAIARNNEPGVSLRAFILGLFFTAGIAFLNCWLMQAFGVGTLGGIQMPFGAIFLILVFVLFINGPLRKINSMMANGGLMRVFSSAEMMTIYVMVLFGALVSEPGCDNQFMSVGVGLFYYQKPENNWAHLFYQYVPSWFVPGWNGTKVQRDVIQHFYLGGVGFKDIPWQAWSAMLVAWSIFLLLTYAVLFFVSLLFRKQWIENEALAFPLVLLPLQMVDVDRNAKRSDGGSSFWRDKSMWLGFVAACLMHSGTGMHSIFPDWPTFPVNVGKGIWLSIADKPWSAMGSTSATIYLGGIGIAYLLNREVALSFWFFFWLQRMEMIGAEMLGFPVASLPKAGVASLPTFLTFQSTGGWLALAVMLVWTARGHLGTIFRAAFSRRRYEGDEPFSPRFIVFGFFASCAGLLIWSSFAGINVLVASLFFGIFLMTSLVLTRLVVEGGLMFPQPSTFALEWMTTGMVGTHAIGAANITKLSFLQPSILLDMRTNVLPGFLHTMKIAHELRLDRKALRRLLLSAAVAIVVGLGVTLITTLWVVYDKGGLAGYTWPTVGAPQSTFTTAATLINTQPGVDPNNVVWTVVGAAVVLLMTLARTRFLWFPLHPLGYIAAATYPISQLWFSFFLGWLIKSIMVKYGGSDGIGKLRPLMIGLILGNLTAMIFWMLVGFKTGAQIGYWPA